MIDIIDYSKGMLTGEHLDLMRFACKYLGIEEDVTVVVAANSTLLNKFSAGDWKIDALLNKSNFADTYTLFIRNYPETSIQNIICHEMVHLWQYLRGDLSLDEKSKVVTWKGEKYDNSFEYDKRPWEVEAFGLQNIIFKAFRKSQKNETRKH